jgi:hypothetical protein
MGCQNPSVNKDQTGQESGSMADHSDGHENHPATLEVQLNQGAKWQANLETTAGIRAMQESMDAYISGSPPENYKALQKKLESDLQLIFQQCTMTGEAHNQLHNYLLPLKKMMDDLDAGDPVKGKETFIRIQQHLAAYDQFFI